MQIDHPLMLTAAPGENRPFFLIGHQLRLAGTTDAGIAEAPLMNARTTGFRITPLGAERTVERAGTTIIESIVVAPDAAAALLERTWLDGRAEVMAIPDRAETDAETWLRAHRAAAARRRYTQLALSGPLGDKLEWAKLRLANAPHAREARAALVDSGLVEAPPHRTAALETDAWDFLGNDGDACAAEFVLAVARGLIGSAPDAAKGRLRLRPLVREAQSFTAENIAVGDALVRMTFERAGESCHFRFAQTAGAMPVRLIFEPRLPNRTFKPLVDGQPADLDVIPDGPGLVLPVQIMLDAERTVDFISS